MLEMLKKLDSQEFCDKIFETIKEKKGLDYMLTHAEDICLVLACVEYAILQELVENVE